MYTLFIDTHSSLITIALISDEEEILYQKESNHSHSKYLLPMIEELLEKNELTTKNINEILVVNGPGSFTGLRIGLTVAKTLAYSLKIPVKIISSVFAYLISSDEKENKVCVIEDTKGYFVGAFDKDNNLILEEKYIIDLDEINNYKQINNKLNIRNIYDYSKNIKEIPVHSLKANYVKKIEVDKSE